MINIAIFASGSGSNAENIFEYFKNSEKIKVSLILSNRKNAYVLERAEKMNVEGIYVYKDKFNNKDELLSILQERNIDFIVLAGFLLLIPEFLIEAFPNKIINIHPALLPKFGGKGMYGDNVHRAVLEAEEKESGITIHYVNKDYDKGKIIFQESFEIEENMRMEELVEKIHELEYNHFPKVIEKTINLTF